MANVSSRELAYCGVMGASALLLPVIFHLIHLGHIFLPMHIPLLTLAFLVRPYASIVTAFVVPILSGATTGMPPFYPPVAIFMSIELSAMCGLISAAIKLKPATNEWLILGVAQIAGRTIYIGLIYLFSTAIGLPADFMSGLSFFKGWPGMVLMMIVIPPVVRNIKHEKKIKASGS